MSDGPRALFLDLDGTLADSLPAMRSIYDAFLARFGRSGNTLEFEALNGPALREIVRALRERHGLEGDLGALEEQYRALIAEHYPSRALPAPGALALLEAAARKRLPVLVVTSAEPDVAQRFLAVHHLAEHIAAVVTAEGLPRGKPDPAVYQRALAHVGLAPADVWAVEDSPNGLRAAVAAGLEPIALWPPSAPDPAFGPIRARIGSLAELVPWLGGPSVDAECDVESVPSALRVFATSDQPRWDTAIERRVDEIWDEERRVHPHRFDGQVFSLVERQGNVLRGHFIPYRYYLAQRRAPELEGPLAIVPLSVSGLVSCGGAVAFARRGERVTQYPGWIELVPSGAIDGDYRHEDGSVDHRAQLVGELAEETGIPEGAIRNIELVALLRDRLEGGMELASFIEVAPGAREAAQRKIGSAHGEGEYDSLIWVPVVELDAFVARHHGRMVPPSRALARIFRVRQSVSRS